MLHLVLDGYAHRSTLEKLVGLDNRDFERELEKKKKTQFEAIITDVRGHGLFVELVESMAFGFVPATTLGDDPFFPSPDGSALVGRKSRTKFSLGARITVEVYKVDRVKRLLDFRLSRHANTSTDLPSRAG